MTKEKEEPKLIYHYTDAIGLEGILREGSLRATHIKYLNDHSELDYSIKLFKEIVEKKLSGVRTWEGKTILGASPKASSDAYYILEEVQKRLLRRFYGIDFYSTSFCAEGDLLSQWRAYGSRKTSFSIGFDRELLLSKIVGGRPELRAIEYNCEKQKKEITEIIDKEISSFEKEVEQDGLSPLESLGETKAKELVEKYGDSIERNMFKVALFYKNKVFKEEREYRLWEACFGLSSKELGRVDFNVSTGDLTPHINFDDIIDDTNKGKIIQKIYVLSPDPESTKKSLEMLLWKYKYNTDNTENVKIEPSEIPIRF